MNSEKPKRIVLHGCYSAKNSDLGIKDKKGVLMKGEHDVFVITRPDKNGYVKVKTITSLENSNTGTVHLSSLKNVKEGRVVPIPDRDINANKLSGVHRRPIWIHKNKLFESKHGFKYPRMYDSIISIDKK